MSLWGSGFFDAQEEAFEIDESALKNRPPPWSRRIRYEMALAVLRRDPHVSNGSSREYDEVFLFMWPDLTIIYQIDYARPATVKILRVLEVGLRPIEHLRVPADEA